MSDLYPPAAWRLVHTPPMDGPANMAIDEAILLAVAAGESLPTLRLFAWDPPCLSLGYAQSSADVDLERLRTFGYDLVRRATGGRAILHVDELTYSVAAPISEPRISGDIVASYRRLSAGLVAGLQELGLRARNDAAQSGSRLTGPVCFEAPSNYEITANGKKLIGSAQMRKRGGVLQHGTLPLAGDIGRICDGLAFPDEAAREEARQRLRARAITLAQALGREVDWRAAAEAVTTGFAKALNLELQPGGLTEAEQENARALRAEKYADEAWTMRYSEQSTVNSEQ